jgi:hypothetical protein
LKRCKTYTLIIIITVAILLSKEVGEMEQVEILNGSELYDVQKYVYTEDAITSRDTIRTA